MENIRTDLKKKAGQKSWPANDSNKIKLQKVPTHYYKLSRRRQKSRRNKSIMRQKSIRRQKLIRRQKMKSRNSIVQIDGFKKTSPKRRVEIDGLK